MIEEIFTIICLTATTTALNMTVASFVPHHVDWGLISLVIVVLSFALLALDDSEEIKAEEAKTNDPEP